MSIRGCSDAAGELHFCHAVAVVTLREGYTWVTPVSRAGGLKGYNTDWLAAISAVEIGLGGGEGALAGQTVVVLGAGGAGRAIAFGAKARGAARVIVANRNFERAQSLAKDVGCEVSSRGFSRGLSGFSRV